MNIYDKYVHEKLLESYPILKTDAKVVTKILNVSQNQEDFSIQWLRVFAALPEDFSISTGTSQLPVTLASEDLPHPSDPHTHTLTQRPTDRQRKINV